MGNRVPVTTEDVERLRDALYDFADGVCEFVAAKPELAGALRACASDVTAAVEPYLDELGAFVPALVVKFAAHAAGASRD